MSEFAFAETDGHLYTITINRPEVMNALHPPASVELSDLFDDLRTIPISGCASSPALVNVLSLPVTT